MRRAIAAALLSACVACHSGTEPNPSPPPTTPTAQTTAPTTPATTAPPIPAASYHDFIGVAFRMTRKDGDELTANALQFEDPAKADTKTPPGSRFVSVLLELTNTGKKSYADDPHQGAMLADRAQHLYPPLRTDPESPGFGSSITIRKGSFKRAWLVFQVPAKAAIRSLRYTTDRGTGPETAEWDFNQ